MTSINCPLFNPTAPQKGEAIVDWLNQLQVEMDSYGAKTKNKRCYDELKRYCAHLYTLYSKEVYKGVVKREIDAYYNTINNNKRLITLNEDSNPIQLPSYPEICKNPSTLNEDQQRLCSSLWVATNPILYNSMQGMIKNLNTTLGNNKAIETEPKARVQKIINIIQEYLIFFSGGTLDMLNTVKVDADFCTQIVKGKCSTTDTDADADLCSCSGGETLNYYLTDPKFSFEKMKDALQGGMNRLAANNTISSFLSPPCCWDLNWPNPDDLPGVQDFFLIEYTSTFSHIFYTILPTKITCAKDKCTGCTPISQGFCVMNSDLDTSVANTTQVKLGSTAKFDFFMIGDYSVLETIDLSDTQIESFVVDLSGLSKLISLKMPSTLRWILLNGLRFTSFVLTSSLGLTEVNTNTNLETIDLSKTQITEFGADLSGLKNLENLCMPEKLKYFDLTMTSDNTKLTTIDLCKTQITEFGADLSGLKNLKSLQMPTKYITCFTLNGLSTTIHPIGISNLEDCTLLKTIDLSNTQITDFTADLSKLKNLEHLRMPATLTSFSLNGLSTDIAPIISNLEDCTLLKTIDLSNTQITDFTADLSKLKNLESLQMPTEHITSFTLLGLSTDRDPILSYLEACTLLETIDLSKTQITEFVADFSDLTKLTNLYMPSTLKSFDLNMISENTNLTTIDLNSTKITDFNANLSGLTNLATLSMPAILKSFDLTMTSDNTKLTMINLSGTQIASFTADLSQLTKLENLLMPTTLKTFTLSGSLSSDDSLLQKTIDHLKDNSPQLTKIDFGGLKDTSTQAISPDPHACTASTFKCYMDSLPKLEKLVMPATLTTFDPSSWPKVSKAVQVDLSNVENCLARPSSSTPIAPSLICFILEASVVQTDKYYTGNPCSEAE